MARVILIISSSIGAIGTEIMNLNLNNPFFEEIIPFCDFLSQSKWADP